MGVDHSPVLIVGWELSWGDMKKIAGIDEDAESYDVVEECESKTSFRICETGWRCYGGDADYYVNLLSSRVEPPITFDTIESLKPEVEKCKAEFEALGVTLNGPPIISAVLYVW